MSQASRRASVAVRTATNDDGPDADEKRRHKQNTARMRRWRSWMIFLQVLTLLAFIMSVVGLAFAAMGNWQMNHRHLWDVIEALWDSGNLPMTRFDYPRNEWRFNGRDANCSRWASEERAISVSTAPLMNLVWRFDAGGDVSGTPTVSYDGVVYFCSWGGRLFAVNSVSGVQLWSTRVADLTGIEDSLCRNSPAIWSDLVIVGDQASGTLMGVNRWDGSLVWRHLMDPHPAAIITSSLSISGSGIAYGGVSSREEALAAIIPGYVCCNFSGSAFAIVAGTGQPLWQTYMVPANTSGGAVWMSNAAIDEGTRVVYVTTGNAYSVPDFVQACINESARAGISDAHCRQPGDYTDSIVALGALDGVVRWFFNASGQDVWTVACLFGPNPQNCPPHHGDDVDFGSGPMLNWRWSQRHKIAVPVVTAGQKSGVMWTVDARTGRLVNSAIVGPGSTLGGIQWGTAFDDRHYYAAISNADYIKYDLMNGSVACGGFWAALRKEDMSFVWKTPVPGSPVDCDAPIDVLNRTRAMALGPVSVANRDRRAVVFAPAMTGWMYALDSSNGRILFSFRADGSVNSGASIVNGVAYFGSGYSNFGLGTPGRFVYAVGFAPPASATGA